MTLSSLIVALFTVLLLFVPGVWPTPFSLSDLMKNPYSSKTKTGFAIPGHGSGGITFRGRGDFWRFNRPTVTRGPWVSPVCQEPVIACREEKFRTADGTCNNFLHPYWGTPGLPQTRLLPPQYHDGVQQPRIKSGDGRVLPSARVVSQVVHSADSTLTESLQLTHLFTVWGQFLDHDVTHTPVVKEADGTALDCCNETLMYPRRDLYWMPDDDFHGARHVRQMKPNCFSISIPKNDRHFRTSCMNFVRSKPFAPTEKCHSATREQGNTQTAYVDASQVYGAKENEQRVLRTGYGGLLRSAEFDLLPRNSTTMCTKRPNTSDFCFGSGDPRVNEHPMLSSLHIVFHRLHNVVAIELAVLNPHWDDERLYQESRKIVGAVMQHVTYAEYLPLVLGDQAMRNYNLALDDPTYKYDPSVDPSIINAFSTAAFRFGHSMVNGKNSYGFQKLNLREMFFHPSFVQHDYGAGLRMVINGLVRDHAQSTDRFMNLDLTDHLFQTKDGRSLDLAALNIQRGRDHGLPPFNDYREFCGLPRVGRGPAREFSDAPFLSAYSDYDEIDLFTGGLSERPVPGGVVGPTFACIIGKQFRNIRLGDRFWYQNLNHAGALTPEQILYVESLGLSDLICLTTSVAAVQISPFLEPSTENPVRDCSTVPPIDLFAWKEV